MKKTPMGILMVAVSMSVFVACLATPDSSSVLSPTDSSTVTISSEDQEFVATLGSKRNLWLNMVKIIGFHHTITSNQLVLGDPT